MITEVLAEEEDQLSDEELEAMADLHRGMVRASFGIYSTQADADALVAAVGDVIAKREFYEEQYDRTETGDYIHKTFRFDHTQVFSIRGTVDAWLDS
jgi:serine/threonine-protein kinase RIO1